MTSIAKASMTRLCGALIEAHLKIEFTLVGAQLLFSKDSFIFVSHFWTKTWSGVLWVQLCLKIDRNFSEETHTKKKKKEKN